MFEISGPAGNHPQWVPEQPVRPAQVNAAPFYLPNLIAAMVASVGVVVGSIGPWITFLALSRNAVGGDGTITLILGIVAGAALFTLLNLGRSRVGKGWMVTLGNIAVLAGVIAIGIGVDDAIAVNSRKTGLFGQTIGAEVGWGLWMVLISSLVLAVTSTVVVKQVPKLRRV